MESPGLSWSQPRSMIRDATSTTWSMGTAPSQGSPKHIETYARTHRPSTRARSTTGANIAMDSFTVRLRFLREGLGRAAEDRDGLDTLGERCVQATLVGHQDGSVATSADLTEQTEQLSGVGELRDPPGRHEACRLDGVQPRGNQAADELGLDLHRHSPLLVLETVARSHLIDGDPPGHTRLGFTLRSSHRLP